MQPRVHSPPARSAEANNPTELTEQDLGRKISVLFKIDSDPDHPFNEAVGMLQRVEHSEAGVAYHLVRKSGETVVVPRDAIVSLKRV